MILYYAVGGGLGHLTRARAVAHTLTTNEPHEPLVIITASPFANDRRVLGEAQTIHVPEGLAGDLEAYRGWLRKVIDRLQPRAIYLDTFPAGILGEFCDFAFPQGVSVQCLGRLLRWEEYQGQLWGTPPSLAQSYVLEPLVDEHESFLMDHSAAVLPLELRDPPQVMDDGLKWIVRSLTGDRRPLWVVVHSSPITEVQQLLDYAQEMSDLENINPRIVLVTPWRLNSLPSHVTYLDLYPADLLFPHADRIITACGFNLMRQTEPYREKHRFMPFVRRFDDQFLRAARRRALE